MSNSIVDSCVVMSIKCANDSAAKSRRRKNKGCCRLNWWGHAKRPRSLCFISNQPRASGGAWFDDDTGEQHQVVSSVNRQRGVRVVRVRANDVRWLGVLSSIYE